MPQLFIPQMIKLYRQGKFPFDRLLKFYNFKDINLAMRDSLSRKNSETCFDYGRERAHGSQFALRQAQDDISHCDIIIYRSENFVT